MVTVIRGTPGDDTLRGTAGADRIEGLGGNDTLAGLRGDDLLLGGAGEDRFRWSAGDGHDRFDGGADRDFLTVAAARGTSLRLHLDALGAGPDTPASEGLQVVAAKGVEAVEILGTAGADRLVVSSDAGVVAPDDVYGRVYVSAGAGRDQVDASGVRAETWISTSTGRADTADAVVKGSARFHDVVETGDGNDVIRTGAGGSWIYSEGGEDEIRLGPGRDYVYEASGFTGDTHETVYGFADDDILFLYDIPRPPSVLDTDGNGRLDRRDGTVTVADGDMTLDLSPVMEGDIIKVTLVDRLAIDLDQLVSGCDC